MLFQYIIIYRNLKKQFGFITTIAYNFLCEFKFKNLCLEPSKVFEYFYTIYTSKDSHPILLAYEFYKGQFSLREYWLA